MEKNFTPQLFTYQSDWLAHIDEFGLTPDYVVSYTGQQIYAPHTKEKPVKRAILKGCTKYCDIDTGEVLDAFEDGRNLELVSVKMPVLTTTGKNLFDGKLERGWSNTVGELIDMNRTRSCLISVKPNESYTVSLSTKSTLKFDEFDSNLTFVKSSSFYDQNTTIITSAETSFIRILIADELDNVANYNLQIEQGTQATSYEPFKSNILTANEEVELRGIGEVQDELNLLTGELTQRIGEIVFDGSESWAKWGTSSFLYRGSIRVNETNNKILNDKLPVANYGSIYDCTAYGIGTQYGNIGVRINGVASVEDLIMFLSQNPITVQYPLETESVKTVDLTIKDQNDLEVSQLSSFNGGTHFSTSSQEGSLLPSISVDVVTDLEETLNICSMDGNTL